MYAFPTVRFASGGGEGSVEKMYFGSQGVSKARPPDTPQGSESFPGELSSDCATVWFEFSREFEHVSNTAIVVSLASLGKTGLGVSAAP